jgi:hypothetical protein
MDANGRRLTIKLKRILTLFNNSMINLPLVPPHYPHFRRFATI